MRDQTPLIGIQADNITAVSLVNLEKFLKTRLKTVQGKLLRSS